MAGLRAARRRGLHARVADRRRRPARRGRRAALSSTRRAPSRGAVILGRPVYDESVPKSRLYGRYLTHVWVWIETLSLTIRDSMCGFRLYPLDAACALIDSVGCRTRMDFDIEILVRLHWRRLAFRVDSDARHLRGRRRVAFRRAVGQRAHQRESYAARVRHAGASADAARAQGDAAQDVRTPRAPSGRLVAHRRARQPARHGAARAQLPPVRHAASRRCGCIRSSRYFLLTGRDARAASRDYFTHLRAAAPQANARRVRAGVSAYRHMLAFAQSGLDKLAAWSGRVDDSRRRHSTIPPRSKRSCASGRGALVIGAHLGNLEMTRALAVRKARMRR